MSAGCKRVGYVGALALVMSAIACTNGVTVDNSNPRGTVGGLIVDAVTEAPLGGVAVTILSAGDDGTYQFTTGADGFYRIGNVPAGAFTIQFGKMGYVTAQTTNTLVGAVGNFPISSPIATLAPIGLFATGPSFVLRVVDANGAAVSGVKATARMMASYVSMENGTLQPGGNIAVTTTSAADGRLVFAGLPDTGQLGTLISTPTYVPSVGYVGVNNILVSIEPVNVMGQDNYQYAGGVFIFSTLTASSTVQQVVLAGPSDPLRIVESNIEWLKDTFVLPGPGAPIPGSVVPTNGPITIAFSEAIDPVTLRAQIVAEAGGAGPTLMPTVNLNLVTLAPATPFEGGKRYNLILHANTALNPGLPNRQRDASVPFFAKIDPATKPSVVSAKLTGTVVQFVLSEPVGLGDGAAQSYTCVVFYEGINFDNSTAGQSLVSGEWSSDPGALTCSTVSPVVGVNPVAGNAGVLLGIENKGATFALPITGYSSQFTATFDQYTTGSMSAAAGGVPIVGTKGHLYFPRLAQTVHRVTGEPVGDVVFTLQ